MNKIFLVSFFLLTQCIPAVIIGSSAVVVGLMCREKGLSGTFTDADLSAKVRSNFAKVDFENSEKLSSKVNISVNNSEILLTGTVDSMDQKMLAEQTVWEVFGVKQVVNQLETKDEVEPRNKGFDSLITGRVKATLLGDKKINIRSFNYSIRTVNGVVYIMGIAKNELERDHALHLIANVNGVKKVISLVRLKHEIL